MQIDKPWVPWCAKLAEQYPDVARSDRVVAGMCGVRDHAFVASALNGVPQKSALKSGGVKEPRAVQFVGADLHRADDAARRLTRSRSTNFGAGAATCDSNTSDVGPPS